MDGTVVPLSIEHKVLAQKADEQEHQTIRQLLADGTTFAPLTAHRKSKAV